MTTVTLHTGSVTTSNTNSVDPSAQAGSGAIWDDGSDSTYSTVYTSLDTGVSTATFQDHSSAPLDVLSLGGGTVTGITLSLRAAKAAATPGSLRVDIELRSSGGTAFLNFADSGDFAMTIPNATATTYTHPVTSDDLSVDGGTLASIGSALEASGNTVYVAAYSHPADPSPFHYGLTVYELSLTVDYTPASGPGATTLVTFVPQLDVIPPLRQFPRSDGLGTPGARRAWPPTPSPQSSNRRVGGYL